MELIDTHQHLFYRDKLSYPWLQEFPALDDDFTMSRYTETLEGSAVKPTGTIFMECDVEEGDASREAHFMYDLAENAPIPLLGVIAAARPEKNGFADYLDGIDHPLLVGIRRVLHVAPAGTSMMPAFVPNLRELARRDLTFDLCVRPDQLDEAIALARAVPGLQFILDHCGSPKLDGSSDPEWSDNLAILASLPNVSCKLSGLTAYGDKSQLTREHVFRTMDTVLCEFGVDRLLWGGDWPVCTINSSMSEWIGLTMDWLESLKEDEKITILSGNARRVYGL